MMFRNIFIIDLINAGTPYENALACKQTEETSIINVYLHVDEDVSEQLPLLLPQVHLMMEA